MNETSSQTGQIQEKQQLNIYYSWYMVILKYDRKRKYDHHIHTLTALDLDCAPNSIDDNYWRR